MDTKDNFDIFLSKNFVRFSGKENVSEWLDETENKFHEFRMVRSLRFRAIPMLIEGDIELKYFRVREYIRAFDDFYVFLLSLYDLEFSTSSKAKFFLKLLDNQFDNPSNGKVECSDEHDYCQIKSIDYFYESLSSEFETNCSFPSEQKFLPIVTDNISNEEFLIPTTLTDNVMERCLDSFDNISSEKETNETCSSITVAFGATNTIGEIPVKTLLMTTTDYSFVVIDQVLNDIRETTVGDSKKNSKMHKSRMTHLIESTKRVDHLPKLLYIPNIYRYYSNIYLFRANALRLYIYNRITHRAWKTLLYKTRKKITKRLQTNLSGKNSCIECFRVHR
ncbi:unnamed protein product [Rotaria magnacalcarata]|uniref:Uncharacterized protein n=1 Tax=Rotaria magnacalcarata TaxID=392030 RepID=A0A814STX6_9BILA|nr:unnamed protein product [Rotaria magnacalcarata]CAF4007588.1 unnamed protein product [Rotaria magnacalcarata]